MQELTSSSVVTEASNRNYMFTGNSTSDAN